MIKIKNLNFDIDKRQILKNIELEIEKYKFIGIIGENGCGKSTLLKNIYRNFKPKNGTILLDDIDLNSYSVKGLAEKLSVLSQNQKITFDFTVKEIVEMGRYTKTSIFSKDTSENEIDEALNKVGMKAFKNQNFLTLSGGEMQRVLIARSIAQESEVLLLDEPTNHLDIRYQYQIMDLVKNLNKTVIAVIHDINIASKYCDYIFAIKNGEILYKGEPDKIICADNIKTIFEIDVEIINHPKTNKPVVIFL
ncbi:ABC transporter ATP-binding protein [uncultured Cetobacterium sp.]|uniref:ABC transporter ATP-binding protein n=1 Tax=uncultured Cetobacterium sp. TaxID=527638 RepID=UPI00260FC555|nr:ABC transporter ATP-binding protein [uncultured Cetobacterium sp.]